MLGQLRVFRHCSFKWNSDFNREIRCIASKKLRAKAGKSLQTGGHAKRFHAHRTMSSVPGRDDEIHI
jgi:hypothetical protein